MRFIWICGHLIRKLLETCNLKEGAGGAVRGTDSRAGGRQKEHPSRRKGGDVPLGYSGRTALRREQCDVSPESRDIGARSVP
jgi:hypothetical protein